MVPVIKGHSSCDNRVVCALKRASTELSLGFVDDDLNLRKRFVHGYKILGEVNELDQSDRGLLH